MFIRSNKLEQLEFKLEKIIGIKKHAGKNRKNCCATNDIKITLELHARLKEKDRN